MQKTSSFHSVFNTVYEITDDSNAKEIWRPIIAFGHLLDYKKTKLYGGDEPFSFWYVTHSLKGKIIVYQEEVQLSFFCPFDFTNYPFDSNVCTLDFGSNNWPIDFVRFNSPNLRYDQESPPKTHSLAEDPIILTNLPHPFEFKFNSKRPFKNMNAYNYSFSYTGMEIKMKNT